MNKSQIFIKISGIILVLVIAVIWARYGEIDVSDSILANAGLLSRTKINWGIKREKDHKQPDLRQN